MIGIRFNKLNLSEIMKKLGSALENSKEKDKNNHTVIKFQDRQNNTMYIVVLIQYFRKEKNPQSLAKTFVHLKNK